MADAGPLIAFGRLDKLPLLGAIFDRVIVPRAVYDETRSRPETPDASAIRAAAQSGALTLDASAPGRPDLPGEVELGEGQAAAIALAAKLGDAVLMDDLQGRSAASMLKLRVVGCSSKASSRLNRRGSSISSRVGPSVGGAYAYINTGIGSLTLQMVRPG
ncbi:MAG: hypothetical protein ACREKH_03355 [Candidatus Rokuibacteriota bacterium]